MPDLTVAEGARAVAGTRNGSAGTQASQISSYLQQHAADWFAEFANRAVEVRLTAERRRTNSRLYRFELEAEGRCRGVFFKIPGRRGGADPSGRPRLVPESDLGDKYVRHFETLRVIHEHFSALADPRFGTVRPLALVPELAGFAMEEVAAEPLRELLPQAARFRPRRGLRKLESAFENVGAWLRQFHALPVADAPTLHANRDEFIELVRRYSIHLGEAIGDRAYFARLLDTAARRARTDFPESCPLGPRFGDFGLTNMLVDGGGRVIGIDTLARYRVPIYEDIAYLLSGVASYRGEILSFGLGFGSKRLALLEAAFLAGYFEAAPIPVQQIRLFEVLRLLDRWSAKLSRHQTQGRSARSHFALAVLDRFFRRRIAASLA